MQDSFTFIDCSCIYNITVQAKNDKYYSIKLRETQENSKIVKNTVWKYKEDDVVRVEITTNQKFALLENQRTGKTHQVSIVSINEADQYTIDSMKSGIEHKEQVQELHRLFRKLGLEFELEYPYYMDDYASLTVKYKGKEIYYGQSVDLHMSNKPVKEQ